MTTIRSTNAAIFFSTSPMKSSSLNRVREHVEEPGERLHAQRLGLRRERGEVKWKIAMAGSAVSHAADVSAMSLKARSCRRRVGGSWPWRISKTRCRARRDITPAGIYGTGLFVEQGGLMSYSSDWLEIFRKAGACIGKILKGAKPADLPVEQPTNSSSSST